MRPGCVTVAEDPAALAAVLAREIVARVESFGRRFALGISGGQTPLPFFASLSGLIAARSARALDVFWCDERLVPPDHPDSNYRAFLEAVRGSPLADARLHRVRGEISPAAARADCAALFERASGESVVLDLAVLGVGSDGHTASIFSGDTAAFAATGPCALARHPGTGQLRLTLTPAFLASAAELVFFVTGADKAAVVAACLGDDLSLPAARIAASHGRARWFLDRAAASLLRPPPPGD